MAAVVELSDSDDSIVQARFQEIQNEQQGPERLRYTPSFNREYALGYKAYTALYIYSLVHVRSKVVWVQMSMCDRRALANGEVAEWTDDDWCSVCIHKLRTFRAVDNSKLHTSSQITVAPPFLAPERERLFRLLGELADPALPIHCAGYIDSKPVGVGVRFCSLPRSLWTIVLEFLRGPFLDAQSPAPTEVLSLFPPVPSSELERKDESGWSLSETRQLVQAVKTHGKHWGIIAPLLKDRSKEACAERWKDLRMLTWAELERIGYD